MSGLPYYNNDFFDADSERQVGEKMVDILERYSFWDPDVHNQITIVLGDVVLVGSGDEVSWVVNNDSGNVDFPPRKKFNSIDTQRLILDRALNTAFPDLFIDRLGLGRTDFPRRYKYAMDKLSDITTKIRSYIARGVQIDPEFCFSDLSALQWAVKYLRKYEGHPDVQYAIEDAISIGNLLHQICEEKEFHMQVYLPYEEERVLTAYNTVTDEFNKPI